VGVGVKIMGLAGLAGMYSAIAMRSNAEMTLFNANQARMGLANGAASQVAAMGDAAYFGSATGAAPVFGSGAAGGNPFTALGNGFGAADSPMMQLYQQDRMRELQSVRASVQLAYADAMQKYYAKSVEDWGKSFNTFNAKA
jgi:hypothetical protein